MLTKRKWPAQAIAWLTPVFLALGLGCQPSGPKSLIQAEQYIKAGQFERALPALKRAEGQLAHHPQLWNHYGLAYHGLGDMARAVQAYQQALRLDRNLAAARYNLGVLYLEQGQLNEAVAELNSFALLQPNNSAGLERLGTALLRQNRPDDAERILMRAIRLDPRNAVAYNSLGLAHLKRKRPREAVQAFNSALQAQPGFGPALLNQAIVAQQIFGDPRAAIERYNAFLATGPNESEAAEARRAVAMLQTQIAAATAGPSTIAATNEIRSTNSVAIALEAARSNLVAQLAGNRTNSATGRTIAQATNLPTIRTNSVASAVHTNRVSAPTVTNLLSARATNRIEPRTKVVAVNTNEPSRAEKASEPEVPVQVVQVIDEPQFKPPVDAPVERTAPVQTPPPAASEEERPLIAPRSAPEEKPGILDRVNPMRLFRREQKTERTVPPPARALPSEADPAEIVQPDRPAVPRNYPRYTYQKKPAPVAGRRAEAEQLFNTGARAHADGKIYDAIALYQQAVAADPAFHDAHYNLGVAAFQAKDLPLALAASEQAVATKPSSTQARYNFAVALRSANYPVDAANEFRELLVDSPDEARAHFALANLYAQQLDEPILARRHYQRVLEIEPGHPQGAAIREWLARVP